MDQRVDEYLKAVFFPDDSALQYEEISEGNINHVFRVRGTETGRSLVLKRAEKESRISPSIILSVSRGKREADYIRYCRRILPNALPVLFDYNKALHLIVLEDLSDRYEVLRTAMIAGRETDDLGGQLANYLTATTFFTSDFFLSHKKKKQLQNAFSNPELCALTERLVFTEPYTGAKENSVSKKCQRYVNQHVTANEQLWQIAAELKYKFMNNAQALIHGDFHFGSVFVNRQDCVVFDPEFCCFGPIGFDLGNLFAHFLMEICFHRLQGQDKGTRFVSWLKQSAEDLICGFETGFAERAEQMCKDQILAQPSFIRSFILSVLSDTAGFAGVECLRRTVGIAKIPEFDLLPESTKALMEREVICAGVFLMEHREAFRTAGDFSRFLEQSL